MILHIVAYELVGDEGYKSRKYLCTGGKSSKGGEWTIGHGHNLTANGLTKAQRERLNWHQKDFDGLTINREQAMYLLEDDIWVSVHELEKIFPEFKRYSDEIQHLLINLNFQLGYSRFIGFEKMIKAVKKMDWKEAAIELYDSDLYREDPSDRTYRRMKRFEKEDKRCPQKK